MKKTNSTFHSFAIALCVFGGCSLEVGNPKKPRPTGAEELSQAAVDSELIGEQTNSSLAVASESAEAASANFMQLAANNEAALADSTNCDSSTAGKVIFAVSRSTTWQTTGTRKKISVTSEHNRSLERTRTITAAGATCTNNRPDINWSTTTSATIQTTTKRIYSQTTDVPAALSSRMPASRTTETTLDHNMSISRITSSGGTSTIQKSSTFSASHSFNLAHLNGTARTVTATSKTLEPMIVNMSIANGVVTSKVLVSGKTETNDTTSGDTIQQTFTNLTYENATNCTPSGGTITGILINTNGSTRDSYTITFVGGKGTLTYASGDSESYDPDCT